MAIVMKYHSWPSQTYGKEVTNFFHNDIKVDYANSSINWDILNENSEISDMEVAKLMILTGTSVHTQYYSYESGASMNGVCHELITTFGYDTNCRYVMKKFYTDREWHSILEHQLENGLPVIYASTMENSWAGHTYVIDGKLDEKYHVNWGWNSDFNGYFSLDLLMPNDTDYSDHQSMVINIKPDKSPIRQNVSPLHIVYGWNTTFRTGKINCTTDNIKRNEPLSVTGPVLSYPNNFHGVINFALIDEDNKILELAKQVLYNGVYDGSYECQSQVDAADFNVFSSDGWRLDNDGGWFPREAYSLNEYTGSFVFTDTDIKPEYKVILVSKEDNDDEWRIVLGLNDMEDYIPVQGIRSEYADVEWIYDPSVVSVKFMDSPLMGESLTRVLRYHNDIQFHIIYRSGTSKVFINDVLIDNLDFSDDYLGEFYDSIENEHPRLMFTTDLPKYTIKIDHTPASESGIVNIGADTDGCIDIYSINGTMLMHNCTREALAKLQPGIYVLRQGAKATKFVVR